MDSGAIDSCIPKTAADAFATTESEMSRNKVGHLAENGSKINNHGEKSLKGWTTHYLPFNIKAQVADVKTPLGSVYQMIRSGNTVVLQEGGSRIIEGPVHIWKEKRRRKVKSRSRIGTDHTKLFCGFQQGIREQ